MTEELARIYAEVYAAALTNRPAATARAAVEDYLAMMAQICPGHYKYAEALRDL